MDFRIHILQRGNCGRTKTFSAGPPISRDLETLRQDPPRHEVDLSVQFHGIQSFIDKGTCPLSNLPFFWQLVFFFVACLIQLAGGTDPQPARFLWLTVSPA